MNIRKPFEKGVHGILHVDWTLKLETPLTIHNGAIAAYKQQDSNMKKGRGMHKDVKWKDANQALGKQSQQQRDEKTGWSQLADFNYQFRIEDIRIIPEYAIPASSIRGTLRNVAITAFVEREDWQCFNLPKKPENDDNTLQAKRKELIDRALRHLHNQQSGWYNILSLFGCVFELEEKIQDPRIWAGRLRLTTTLGIPTEEGIDGEHYADSGPANLKRHITVRNPLDRVTMAAKEGGLHFSMEMSAGESFGVHLEILNPRQTDLDLLEAWREDIDDGFLRFGALTSQGRGRTSVTQEKYRLYLRANHHLAEKLSELPDENLFSGIWKGREVTFSELKTFLACHSVKP